MDQPTSGQQPQNTEPKDTSTSSPAITPAAKIEQAASALDRIENTLYDPKQKKTDFAVRQAQDRVTKELPTSWGDNTTLISATTTPEKMSFGVKLLILSTVVLVAALSYTAWRVLSSRNVVSSANIDIVLDVAPYIEGGEATPLVVKVTNRNGVPLQSTSLTLMYKKGLGSQDEEEKVNEKRESGDLSPGVPYEQSFSISLFGKEAEQRDVTIKFEYKVAGSNAVFSKLAVVPVILKTPPMSVSIDGPSTLSVGQSGTYAVTIKNNTSTSTSPSVLLLTLPKNFTVENASPKPASPRASVWSVPILLEGEEHTVTLSGTFSGSQGEVSTMKAVVGSQGASLTDLGVVYVSQTYDVKLRSSPLLVTLALEAESGSSNSLRYGDVANIIVSYKNTGTQPIKTISLLMNIKGEAVSDRDIIPDSGYYDSVKKIITWDPASLPDLGTLQAGAENTLRIRMPIVLKGINSPKLILDINGTGSMIETGDIVTNVSKSWSVQGSATISAETRYKNSPFTNVGAIPPVPNMDTTYTAHISVSAQNALTNTKVSFTLPIYVTWRNTTSDSGNIIYDPKSRLVTWSPGQVGAGKSVAVDIGLTVHPSQSQVGQSPAITSSIILDAVEDVSHVNLHTTLTGLTTFISGENWPTNPSRVVDR